MFRKLTIELITQESNNKNISNLSTLNLSGKNINDISILSKFPSLENITLSKNQIKDLSVFKNLKNIKNLNLKDNKITEFSQLESLKNCKQLEFLCLKENPISKEQIYLQKVKEILPQLKKLDDIEINKHQNNKDVKIPIKADNKKIDKLNMITNKLVKIKNKNNKSPFHANAFIGSPTRPNKQKSNNNDINKINSSGKKDNNKDIKGIKEKKKMNINNINDTTNKDNYDNKKNKNEKVESSDKKPINNSKNEVKDNANNNDDEFENMNINDEKKKIEDELKNEDKNKPKKKKELLSYSFKKKKTGGTFYKFNKKNKDNSIDANATLDNIKIDNQLISTFNDENKNLNYSISNSRYSRKIIGKFPGGHSLLSQSIRYDDNNQFY